MSVIKKVYSNLKTVDNIFHLFIDDFNSNIMTGCCADYCTNSSTKGHQMCRFPREPKRRKIWIENVNRADWIPSSNAMLCDVSQFY